VTTSSIPKSISSTEYVYSKSVLQSQISTSTAPNNVGSENWWDTKIGSDNPHWREQIRRGSNATTSYSTSVRDCFRLQGHADRTYTDHLGRTSFRGWSGHPRNISWGLTSPVGLSSSLADLLARQQFIASYRKRRTAFQSGVFLGELRQVVEMIRRPASALRDGIDRYHGAVKERLRRSRHRRSVIQDTWLEYVFGWKPLIGDIEDACRLATASPMAVFMPIRGIAGSQLEKTTTRTNHTLQSGCRCWFNRTTTGDVTVEYKGAIRADTEPPGFPEQLGLSWSNVLPTVWELVPYSFLFDYFTNIGKVVEGISTGPIRLAWGYQAITKSRVTTISGGELDMSYMQASIPPGGTGQGSADLAGILERFSTYSRSPVSSVSIGLRDFRFRFNTGSSEWLNIAALARLRR
jgi:hypothetical protein